MTARELCFTFKASLPRLIILNSLKKTVRRRCGHLWFNWAQAERLWEHQHFRHLEEHFPCVSIYPHKEDYCDKCKVLGTDCRFVVRKITESEFFRETAPRERVGSTLQSPAGALAGCKTAKGLLQQNGSTLQGAVGQVVDS